MNENQNPSLIEVRVVSNNEYLKWKNEISYNENNSPVYPIFYDGETPYYTINKSMFYKTQSIFRENGLLDYTSARDSNDYIKSIAFAYSSYLRSFKVYSKDNPYNNPLTLEQFVEGNIKVIEPLKENFIKILEKSYPDKSNDESFKNSEYHKYIFKQMLCQMYARMADNGLFNQFIGRPLQLLAIRRIFNGSLATIITSPNFKGCAPNIAKVNSAFQNIANDSADTLNNFNFKDEDDFNYMLWVYNNAKIQLEGQFINENKESKRLKANLNAFKILDENSKKNMGIEFEDIFPKINETNRIS